MHNDEQRRPSRVVRRKDLPKYIGKRHTEIDLMIRNGEFPPGVLVSDGGRARIWFEDEIVAWQDARREQKARAR
jgi:predicted DNA-binding transcriptional regulator AlpA